jgi:hypothetical protein
MTTGAPPSPLSSRRKRTRISYYLGPPMAAKWRDLQFSAYGAKASKGCDSGHSMMTGAPPSPLSSRPKRSEVEGPAVLSISIGSAPETLPSPLSSRPERTRISYYLGPPMAACAAFRKERRMKFAKVTKLDRKSVVAKWRDLQFPAYDTKGQP